MAEKIFGSEAQAYNTSGDVKSPSSKEEAATNVNCHYDGKDTAEETALIRKQDLRILPLCSFMYLLAYLDRSNIGNAKVLNADTNDDVCFPSQSLQTVNLTILYSCFTTPK